MRARNSLSLLSSILSVAALACGSSAGATGGHLDGGSVARDSGADETQP